MTHRVKRLYEFGVFRLDPAERLLLRGDKRVPLTSKVFDILTMLVENRGRLLEKDELMQAIWPDTAVEEGNLTRYVSTLRKALSEGSNGHQYIETVPKRGYRFVADVRVLGAGQEDLIFHEQTRMQVTIEHEEETDDRGEVDGEIEARLKPHARAQPSRRMKRRALIAGVIMLVIMIVAAYWWKTIKTRQAETHAQIRSIAVLPFKQLGEGEKDELVGFGIADVLITRIGSLNRTAVRPTSAVFKYVGAEPDIAAVGSNLKVDAVLEGSYQIIGDRIRATARLVRAQNGELVWAQPFDGRIRDLFQLQDDMSTELAIALSLNPADEQKKQLTKRFTKSSEAQQAYTRARFFWNKRSLDGLMKSIEYFEEAIKMDPNYGLAFAGLSDSYSLLVNYCQIEPEEGFLKANEAATTALRLDETLAEPHASLAKIHHLYHWDWEEAEREFKRAIELNPSYATAHQWYSEYLISMARFDEAKAEAKRALELDPVSLAINIAQGFPYYYNREYDEAIAAYQRALELDTIPEAAHSRLMQVYIQSQMYDQAIAEYCAIFPNHDLVKSVYAASGIRGLWEMDVAAAENEAAQCCTRQLAAQSYTYLGDKDNAFRLLEKACQNRCHNMASLKVEPAFDGLRSDPRFADLLRRMRLDP
jgi:DNA-binding winged helix-turn-helix (wHTH) protein/TolB-like protein/Tfp pilus assembly protein PilF